MVFINKNYDNYKIIENILNEKLIVNINHLKKAKKIELKDNLIDFKLDFEEKEKIDVNENKGDKKQIKESSDNLDLPSLNFFNFLGHAFILNVLELRVINL